MIDNQADHYQPRSQYFSILFVQMLGIVIIFFSVLSGKYFNLPENIIYDPFHQGEYFAIFTTLMKMTVDFSPLSIHGALDYIPAWLALHFHSPDNYFLTTIFIYGLAELCSVLVLYLIVIQLTQTNKYQPLILVFTALFVNELIGYRDLILVLSLYIYIISQKNTYKYVNILLEVGLGLTIAFGLFWSFDRGIVGTIAIGAGSLILAYYKRKYIISIAVFFITLIITELLTDTFLISAYIENIQFLVTTSSQWSYDWNSTTIQRLLLLAIPNILAVSFLLSHIKGSARFYITLANSLMLVILITIMFKIAINRIDWPHIVTGLWAPALAILYVFSNNSHIKWSHKKLQTYFFIMLISLLTLLITENNNTILIYLKILCFILVFIYIQPRLIKIITLKLNIKIALHPISVTTIALSVAIIIIVNSFYKSVITEKNPWQGLNWLSSLASPPTNQHLISDATRWVAEKLQQTKANCIFDLTNHGIINGATGLPTCTRFTYLVYTTPAYEQEVIASLKKSKPPVIIYSSTHSSYSIDGKTMPARLPVLDYYLLKEYPFEQCKWDYCLRYTQQFYINQSKSNVQ